MGNRASIRPVAISTEWYAPPRDGCISASARSMTPRASKRCWSPQFETWQMRSAPKGTIAISSYRQKGSCLAFVNNHWHISVVKPGISLKIDHQAGSSRGPWIKQAVTSSGTIITLRDVALDSLEFSRLVGINAGVMRGHYDHQSYRWTVD